jgi:EmrB/QacA subfamily drug resistance transporter
MTPVGTTELTTDRPEAVGHRQLDDRGRPHRESSDRSAKRAWLVLVAMTGSLSMIMLDQTVVTVALPSMARDLLLSPSGQQWVIGAYVLALAAFVALGGRLGDVLGRVKTFQLGMVVFAVGSVACGFAPVSGWGETWIIASRAGQGIGAGLMMPASAAIVISAFAPSARGRAMAAYAGISQLFLVVGPVIGGVLAEDWTWRAVFWLNVPVALLSLILVRVAKPANVAIPGSRMRYVDAAFLVGGVLMTVLAIQESSRWSSSVIWPVLSAGLVLMAAFAVRQLRVSDPLVDVRLLGKRPFLGANLALAVLQFALTAVVLYGSLYNQQILGFSPIEGGLAALPLILGVAVASQVGGRWYDRSGARRPALTGLAIALVGLALWTASLPGLDYRWQVPGMLLAGLGIGLTLSPVNTDALSRVADHQRGQAAGIVQTMRQLGGTLGVAVIGTIVLNTLGAGSGRHDAAHAVAIGFAASTVVLVVAILAAAWLLPKQRH